MIRYLKFVISYPQIKHQIKMILDSFKILLSPYIVAAHRAGEILVSNEFKLFIIFYKFHDASRNDISLNISFEFNVA